VQRAWPHVVGARSLSWKSLVRLLSFPDGES
jgi:hypothetical protein